MKTNLILIAFILVAGEAFAQSGTLYQYPGTGFSAFQDSQSGLNGTIYSYPGTGFQSYQDSTGRTGTIYTYPGTGFSNYQFSEPPAAHHNRLPDLPTWLPNRPAQSSPFWGRWDQDADPADSR